MLRGRLPGIYLPFAAGIRLASDRHFATARENDAKSVNEGIGGDKT